VWTVYSIPVSALYLLVILPAVHNFETLVLVCAPAFLAMGVTIARPSTFGRGMPFLFGLCGTLALIDTHTADLVSFTNGMLSQLLGLTAAAVFTSVLRRVGAGWTARRLLKAGWRELARLGEGGSVSLAAFSARMVDRIGLLTPRLALAGPQEDLAAFDALRDLRIGLNMTLLKEWRGRAGHGDAAVAPLLAPLLKQLGKRFARLPEVDAGSDARLLASLDATLRAACADTGSASLRRDALAALTGMRRDLFPHAAPWSHQEKETA
jgi:uncharacterized membrane protein YccC